MQIWDDSALDEHMRSRAAEASPELDPEVMGAIQIRSADPLAKRALAAALEIAGLGEQLLLDEPGAGESIGLVVYDDGQSPPPGPLRPEPEAEEPWLALVASGSRAKAALSGGFLGALGRDSTPERLAVAIGALQEGLVAIDPRFASDVLPHKVTLSAPLALTPREHEVLELLAEGLSNKEIGAQLGVSPHTSKFHVTALLDKLGAETRTEAVVLAARYGLIDL